MTRKSVSSDFESVVAEEARDKFLAARASRCRLRRSHVHDWRFGFVTEVSESSSAQMRCAAA